ncbi:hypothetical protein F9U64_17125 [Gracilibacillus oryzae]|uniref:Uncharacterized protein n=1 Tax=Gracilibacillus oryzae TaxID=1672701 RepID=A0A7C8GS35_9BACI|nr:hypothetical protein F9U64_17125 [Gracilibacillus oryzae]
MLKFLCSLCLEYKVVIYYKIFEWEGKKPYYHITDLRRCVSWLKK